MSPEETLESGTVTLSTLCMRTHTDRASRIDVPLAARARLRLSTPISPVSLYDATRPSLSTPHCLFISRPNLPVAGGADSFWPSGSRYLWGSYTNGAGLYNRTALAEDVGRMFGEPGDGFHDS